MALYSPSSHFVAAAGDMYSRSHWAWPRIFALAVAASSMRYFMNRGADPGRGGCRRTLRPGAGCGRLACRPSPGGCPPGRGLPRLLPVDGQTHGGGDGLVGGGEPSASHLGLDELLEICRQMGVHIGHLLHFSTYHGGPTLSSRVSGWGIPGTGEFGEFRAGWPQGIASLGLPQIRTCTFAHTAPHIMSTLRDGSLSESALRLVPDAATVVVSCTRLWVSMHPPCFPPTVS